MMECKLLQQYPAGTGIHAAAYCRVSTEHKNQRSSIERQKEHYETLIAQHPGWIFAGIYTDDGISATKAETRPELQRLLSDCRAGKIDLILTKSVSRFARNTAQCLSMVRLLTSLGVSLYFEKEHIHTGTMESELMLSLLSCFAQEESRSISASVKWGIRRRFQDGTYRPGHAPYGYRTENGTFSIIPQEAEVVCRIFRMTLSGNGMVNIAKVLNEEGISSPRGGKWTACSLRQIVKNPAYKGALLCQKTWRDEDFRAQINYGELDQYYMENHHDAIVSGEDFDRAQAAIGQRAKEVGYTDGRERKRGGHRYCFSGILSCAFCGSVLYRMAYSKEKITWICKKHSSGLCAMKPQPAAGLEAAFINCLNRLSWSQGRPEEQERVLDVYEGLVKRKRQEENAVRLETIGEKLRQGQEEIRLLAVRSTQELKAFVAGWTVTGDPSAFPEDAFGKLVERCTVRSWENVMFHFRCGLDLEESLLNTG